MTEKMNKKICREKTLEHIKEVRLLLLCCIEGLVARAEGHDRSKMKWPEIEIFTKYTPRLASSTYGSKEYKQFLKKMKPALDHHYAHNRHHAEHFSNGIRGMNLLDLLEVVCDWTAAAKRHKMGDIRKSIEINQKRFHYSDDLKQILKNTLEVFKEAL